MTIYTETIIQILFFYLLSRLFGIINIRPFYLLNDLNWVVDFVSLAIVVSPILRVLEKIAHPWIVVSIQLLFSSMLLGIMMPKLTPIILDFIASVKRMEDKKKGVPRGEL